MKHKFKLDCFESNGFHTRFKVFDPRGANCGELCILTQDAASFVADNWNGLVFWNGHEPKKKQVHESQA